MFPRHVVDLLSLLSSDGLRLPRGILRHVISPGSAEATRGVDR